jgi:hypothetical protein
MSIVIQIYMVTSLFVSGRGSKRKELSSGEPVDPISNK